MGKESEMDERILTYQAGARESVSASSERQASGDTPSPCFTVTNSRLHAVVVANVRGREVAVRACVHSVMVVNAQEKGSGCLQT